MFSLIFLHLGFKQHEICSKVKRFKTKQKNIFLIYWLLHIETVHVRKSLKTVIKIFRLINYNFW